MLRQLMGSVALDLGPILAAYLGTLAIGAACIAVGLLASCLTRSQIVAATITFALLTLLLLAGPLELYVEQPALREFLRHVNLFDHMEDFARGIVDTRQLRSTAARWPSACSPPPRRSRSTSGGEPDDTAGGAASRVSTPGSPWGWGWCC